MPGSWPALAITLLAIVPGFVATTAWARARTWRGPSPDFRTVLESLATSVVVQVAASPLTIAWLYPKREVLEQFPERVALWVLLVAVVLPIVGGALAGRLTDQVLNAEPGSPPSRPQRLLAAIWPPAVKPTLWDWFFTESPPHGQFLLIEFTDGSRIAGVFAEGSMALTSPEPHGLFLSSEWLVGPDGEITEEVVDGRGILIPDVANIRSVRLLQGG